MKYQLTLWITLLVSTLTMAQQHADPKRKWLYQQKLDAKKISLGLFLGLNNHQFLISNKRYTPNENIDVDSSIGYDLGFLIDYRLNDYFSLRLLPTWSNTQRSLKYPYLEDNSRQNRLTKSDYIRLPLLLKVNTKRIDNLRPYLTTGFSLGGDFTSENLSKSSNLSFTYDYQIGGGIEFYFKHLKVALDFRGILTLNSELGNSEPDIDWNNNIKSLHSRAFVFGIVIQ